MKASTTRFGDLEVEERDIILFPEGPLGFENLTRFFIIDPGDDTFIMWMQSLDDSSVAFPIIETEVFCPNYGLKLLPSDLRSLDLENATVARIYSILTIPKDVTQMSANLKAPIVLNPRENMARQIVLQDSKLSVDYKVYKDLKAHIITTANTHLKKTSKSQKAQKGSPPSHPTPKVDIQNAD
ncbi:MAG: flagellar assembly protein FliW [Bacteriovoracales bacterium]|nr:flagellar assembly protein FliW [Bacteriovoracales bacterium]